jgi:hypothetical protein
MPVTTRNAAKVCLPLPLAHLTTDANTQNQMATHASNADGATTADDEHRDKRRKTDSKVCLPVPSS